MFAPDFIRRIDSGEPLVAVAPSGRRGSAYDIFVAASIVAIIQREGELAIDLARRPDGEKLRRLSLCFAEVKGEPAMIVGGVQGPASAYKRAIIDATRDLYGLRPKDAVFLAARAGRGHRLQGRSRGQRRQPRSPATAGQGEILPLRLLLARTRRPRRRPPYGFVFGPLEPIAATDDKRDAAKRAVVEQRRALVAAQRATD